MPACSQLAAARFAGIRRRLLVVERGAALLTREEVEPENFDETVTLAQMRDESADEFSERVVHRIGTAARSAPFSRAVLYTASTCEDAAVRARRLIALAVAAHAEVAASPAELVVMTSAGARGDELERLLELTDDLVLGTEGVCLPVRLRFVAASAQAVLSNLPEARADAEPVAPLPLRRAQASPAEAEERAAWPDLAAAIPGHFAAPACRR